MSYALNIYLGIVVIFIALLGMIASFHLFRVSRGDVLHKPAAIILILLGIFTAGVMLDLLNIDILGSKELLSDLLRIVVSAGIAVPTILLYLQWRRQEVEERPSRTRQRRPLWKAKCACLGHSVVKRR